MNDFFWYSKIYFIYLSIRSIWAFINRASIRHFGCQAYRSFACPSSANTRSRMHRNFGYKQERKSVITFVNYSLWPRHTNEFLFENPNILLCFNVPSTRKRKVLKMFSRVERFENATVSNSLKTQSFENVLQSGKIWKRNSIEFTENANFWSRDLCPSPLSKMADTNLVPRAF